MIKRTSKQKWEEKQLYVYFKRQTNQRNLTWEVLDIYKKRIFKRESEPSLITATYNAIRTNYVKVKIDKPQQNNKCKLCIDRDKTINHMISECSKLARKENTIRHTWVGKVIHWKLCQKSKLGPTTKWFMHKAKHPLEEWDAQTFSKILRYKQITKSRLDDQT